MMLQFSKNEVFKFFQEHTLKARWHELFNSDNIVRDKIYEFLNNPILKGCKGIGDYSYGYIYHKFKYYFFSSLLKEAIEIAITTEGKTDLLANVLSLFDEERLKKAVEGEMMIDAVVDVLKEIKTETASESVLIDSKIYRLTREFLDKNGSNVESFSNNRIFFESERDESMVNQSKNAKTASIYIPALTEEEIEISRKQMYEEMKSYRERNQKSMLDSIEDSKMFYVKGE